MTASTVKFLLVDDLESNLLALEGLLRREGLELLKARSGSEALELLLVHDVDLALLDVQMPGMDGFELAELMRGAERTRRVPIIFLTAGAHDQQRRFRGYEAGAVDFLFKPIEPHILQSKAGIFFEFARQRDGLIRSAAEARAANRAKADFLSNMSHELRTPLNAILGFAQLMESEVPPLGPSQKASIDEILRAGWYLLKLINEILDLAVIESGRLLLSLEPVSLTAVLFECQSMIEPLAQKRNISMSFPRFDKPVFVMADHTRVKQVLINLLSNAIKYNSPGGAVVVDCVAVTSQRVNISVRDTGGGLTQEKLTQLFQSFNRLGQEGSSEEGSGIGLVVSKRLVELMKGTMGVESTVGAGSVFWIELNSCDEPHRDLNFARPVAAGTPEIPAGAPVHTLLYVEDNPANLKLVEQLIARRSDLRLLTATEGRSGIDIARTSQPEVILMDINLPGISGFDALKLLKEDPATAHIPIIAVSANAIPRDVEKGLEAGFFRYLTKPIKFSELMDTLNDALELRGPGAAGRR